MQSTHFKNGTPAECQLELLLKNLYHLYVQCIVVPAVLVIIGSYQVASALKSVRGEMLTVINV